MRPTSRSTPLATGRYSASLVRIIDVASRELRNHTVRVLNGVEAGTTVYLTRSGKRIARIEPLLDATNGETLLELLGDYEPYDSGLTAFLDDDDAASMVAEGNVTG